jgi:hypothetical protein
MESIKKKKKTAAVAIRTTWPIKEVSKVQPYCPSERPELAEPENDSIRPVAYPSIQKQVNLLCPCAHKDTINRAAK